MRIIGNAQLGRSPAEVYRALNDPAVLVRCLPGCQRLEALGEDAYAMTVAAGVGSIKGVYDGTVRLSDQHEPASFRMHADGAGAAGTIAADVRVSLEESDQGAAGTAGMAGAAGTSLTYDAEATVGGMIGGVGQRMLVGVSKRMAAEFFDNVDAVLGDPDATSSPPPDDGGAPRPSGAVFTAPTASASTTAPGSFARGVAVGAVAALAGAVVGAWVSRRAQR